MGLVRLEFPNSVNGDFDYIVYKQKTNFKRFPGIRVYVWFDNLLGASFASLNFLTQKIQRSGHQHLIKSGLSGNVSESLFQTSDFSVVEGRFLLHEIV